MIDLVEATERSSRGHTLSGVLLVCSIANSLLTGIALAAGPEVVWETAGFASPESAWFDPARKIFYVSNVKGQGHVKDNNGYISKVSAEGKILKQRWVTGLDAPKGLALYDGKLYVADITELVVIDAATGKIVARHEARGSTFLNDVAARENGEIFVSDMVTNTIYVLNGDHLEVWLQDAALENPNGLLAEQNRLVVGAWGVMAEDFSTKVPGHLMAVDYDSKEITSIGDGKPVGNLDGLESDGKGGYFVTDWLKGGLLNIASDGKVSQVMDLNQGSADLEFVAAKQLLVIPMMVDGKLVAYGVE